MSIFVHQIINANTQGMKRNYIGIGLAVAAIGLYYYSKGRAGSKLNVVASNAKNLRVSGLALEFDLELTFANPTNQNLSINGIGGYCYLNNTIVATTSRNESVNIERYGNTKVLVPTRIQFSSAVYATKEVVEFFRGTPLTLKWKGEARTLGLSLPLETSFVINKKTALV